MVNICKIVTFAAAHSLPFHKGKCYNVHGHNYKLEVEVSGIIRTDGFRDHGMIMDFGHLSEIVDGIIGPLDHSFLNVLHANPTAEIMVSNIAKDIKKLLPESVSVTRVRLWETDTCYAEWRKK